MTRTAPVMSQNNPGHRRSRAAHSTPLDGSGLLTTQAASPLTEPAVTYSESGRTWNEAFAKALTESANELEAALLHLDRVFTEVARFQPPTLLFPLHKAIFSLRISRRHDNGTAVVDFFRTGLVTATEAFDARFVLCARLSGLAAKQTAILLGTNTNKVETLSKTSCAEYLALKAQMAAQNLQTRVKLAPPCWATAAPAKPVDLVISEREAEVLRAYAQACTAEAGAKLLGTTVNTYRTHLKNIARKLGVSGSNAALTSWYLTGRG